MRVTDSRDGDRCTVAYSYWPTFSELATKLFVLCDDAGTLYDFSKSGFTISNKRPLYPSPPPGRTKRPEAQDTIWSGIYDNVVFGHDKTTLWKYNVVTKTYTRLKDFSSYIGTGRIFQMSRSMDDNVFAFSKQSSSGTNVGYIVWKRDTNRILINRSTSVFDEVQLDKTGDFLTVKYESGSVRVHDLVAKTETLLRDGSPDYAPGHSDNGTGTVVGMDNWYNRCLLRDLDSPHPYSSLQELGSDWSMDHHVSMLANNEGWALLSSYVVSGARANKPFQNEIYQIATDGSERVRRHAHHRSVNTGDYYDAPHANISRNGQFIAFTSNWGGRSKKDVFILKVIAAPND